MKNVALILLFSLGLEGVAKAVVFDMRDAPQRNLLLFTSEALLEKMVAVTNALWGRVELDPADISQGVKLEFDFDVRMFESGLPSRNRFIVEKIFAASQFPTGKLSLSKLTGRPKNSLLSGKAVSLDADGILALRGISQVERMKILATYLKASDVTSQRMTGNLLKLQVSIDVDLVRYKVDISDKVDSRLSRMVQIQFNVVGSDQSPNLNLSLPEGTKPKEVEVPEGTKPKEVEVPEGMKPKEVEVPADIKLPDNY